ncbi:MAG TPA: hypothetical protein ENK43_14360 [Planctomycetes bacterium]|nr:hypothetical protein [Planctomycetota bacterium]
MSRLNGLLSKGPGPAAWPLLAIVLLAAFVRLHVSSDLAFQARDYTADDMVHARQTAALVEGRWLGSYDQYILVKSPGYAFFLAGARSLGLTRRRAEDLLHVAACLILLSALLRLGFPRTLAAAAYLTTLFHPVIFGEITSRLVRDGVHADQTLILAGLAGHLCARCRHSHRVTVAVLLGGVAAWTALTRAEAVLWLLPGGLLALVIWSLTFRHEGRGRLASLALAVLLAVPTLVAVPAAMSWVERRNEAVYGVAVVNELEEPAFVSAVAALRRVALARWRRFEPLSAELRTKLYAASPTFAELAPELESKAWRNAPMLARDGNRKMQFLVWAMRDAAAHLGYHQDAKTARAFYARLAREINTACDDGRLPGGARQTSQIPALRSKLFPHALRRWAFEVAETWRLRDHWVDPGPRLPLIDVDREDLGVISTAVGPLPVRVDQRFLEKGAVLRGLRSFLRLLFSAAPLLALVATLTQLGLVRRCWKDPLFRLEILLFTLWMGRSALVALLETYWFEQVGVYLAPAYLIYPAWLIVALHAYARFQDLSPLRGRWRAWAEAHRVGTAVGSAALIALGVWGLATWERRADESLMVVEEFPELPDRPMNTLAPPGRTGMEDGHLVIGPERPTSLVTTHVVETRLPKRSTLVLRGAMPGMEYGDPWRLHLLLDRGLGLERSKVLIFNKGPGPATWRIPLHADRWEVLIFEDPLAQGATLALDGMELVEETRPLPDPLKDCRIRAAWSKSNHTLTLSVEGGEAESLYQFVFGTRLLKEPGVFQDFAGDAWLAPEGILVGDNNRPLRLRVVTDASGRGRRNLAAPELSDKVENLYAQAIGLTHLSPRIRVTVMP